MRDFIKKSAGGATDLGTKAITNALKAIIGEITKELISETGVADLAKEKVMSTGLKVVKELGINVGDIKKTIIKEAIKKELNI